MYFRKERRFTICMKYRHLFSFLTLCLLACTVASAHNTVLTLRQNDATNTISVYRENDKEAILTQNARPDFRPYLHPIVAPDGKGFLTESSPEHQKHQTGLYWGLKQVNGRDYFHNPGAGVTFTVESSDTLATNSWSASGVTETILTDDGTVQTVKASIPSDSTILRRYMHLKVTAP